MFSFLGRQFVVGSSYNPNELSDDKHSSKLVSGAAKEIPAFVHAGLFAYAVHFPASTSTTAEC